VHGSLRFSGFPAKKEPAIRTTIKDIAKKTGLSITTVSLVLNRKGGKFPAETKRAVLEAVDALNYRPNQLAISLLTRRTHTIGLIIPDISNIFFSELAKGIADRGRQDDYTVILCNSNDEYPLEQQCINTLADRSVDGIIMVMSAESFGSKNKECVSVLLSLGFPVILVDCFNDSDDFSTITIDNKQGSCLAVQHLLDLGHSRIGCISGPQRIKTNRDRLEGYTKTLKQANRSPEPALIYEGDFRYHGGYEGALHLLKQKPTAIFCHNDMMAIGAAKAVKEKGFSVPEDISIIGFDDIFFTQYMDVPLSTVAQPVYHMGQEAAAVLLEEIADGNKPKRRIMYPPRLIIRQSTAPPPSSRGPSVRLYL
jgi:LacI family transcriptional regulator